MSNENNRKKEGQIRLILLEMENELFVVNEALKEMAANVKILREKFRRKR